MKRKVIASVLIMIILSMLSLGAVSLKAGLGPVSSLGVSFNKDTWDFSADIRSTFPLVPTAGFAAVPRLLGDGVSFESWFKYSSTLFSGIGAEASYRVMNTQSHILSFGLTTVFGLIRDPEDGVLNILPDYENILLAVLEVNASYTYNVNDSSGIFLSVGFPVMGVPGNNNAYSIKSMIFGPHTFFQIETGGDMPGITRKALLVCAAAPLKIGYVHTF